MDDARQLLARLAQEVDGARPPADLLHRARRQRRRRTQTRTAVLGVLAGLGALAVGVALPAAISPTVRQPAVTLPDAGLPGAGLPGAGQDRAVPPGAAEDQPLQQEPTPPGPSAADLQGGTWAVGARSPDGARDGATLTWTGREVLVVGGDPGAGSRTAAAYDPALDTWRRLPPVPTGRRPGAQVWLGDRLFTFPGPAGDDLESDRGRAALYRPAQDRWDRAAQDPLGELDAVTAVAVGARVLVIGGRDDGLHAAWYDPDTDRWTDTAIPSTPGHAPAVLTAVSTPAGVLVWSAWTAQRAAPGGNGPAAGIDVLRLTATWQDETARWDQDISVQDPQLLNGSVVFPGAQRWCGPCSQPLSLDPIPARSTDPRTLQLGQLPVGPLDAARLTLVLTGGPVLAVNLSSDITYGDGSGVTIGDTALYDPQTQAWTELAPPPARLSYSNPPVWAGDRLVALTAQGHALLLR